MTIMTDIEIGDHVVCINGKFLPSIAKLFDSLPKEGVHYVVRDVLLGVHHPSQEGSVRILLVGLVNPSPNGKALNERGFDARRFRKLDQLKAIAETDEKISHPRKEKVLV